MFVILQQDVVIRFVQFDQVAFKDQRFQVGFAQQDVEIADMRDHRFHLGRVGRLPEIAPDPVLQVHGLAHIDDLARVVLHQVTAGRVRQHPDLFFQSFAPAVHCLLPFPE